jgi:hypothetical protein
MLTPRVVYLPLGYEESDLRYATAYLPPVRPDCCEPRHGRREVAPMAARSSTAASANGYGARRARRSVCRSLVSTTSAGRTPRYLVSTCVDIKTAQTRLGHSDPRLTLAIYAQSWTTAAPAQAGQRTSSTTCSTTSSTAGPVRL